MSSVGGGGYAKAPNTEYNIKKKNIFKNHEPELIGKDL